MTRRIAFLVILVSFLVSSSAWAGPRDFVISMSGFLGTTEQAAPVLSKLFRQLESSLGWPENSIDGAYYPDAEEGLAAIKQRNPGFAVVSHQMYAEHRSAMKMQVIASMELSEGALSRYHVVTKKSGGPAKLSELQGRSIASPFTKEARFVERVLFGGALALGPGDDQAHPIYVSAPLRALRKVHRGQADSALVDEPVVAQMSKLPFGSELQVIHTSSEILPLPVVALGTSTASDRRPMAKALQSLCEGDEGAALCGTLRLSKIRAASNATFSKISRQLSR